MSIGAPTRRAILAITVCLSLLPVAGVDGNERSETARPDLTLEPPDATLRVGERLSFEGRWFGIPVGGGAIEVAAREQYEGREVYRIEARGSSNDFLSTFYPVEDVITSYIDAETLHPLRFEKSQREGRYRAEEVVTFDYSALTATYRSKLNGSVKQIPMTAEVHDLISVFYWIRTHPIDPARPFYLDIYSDEKIYRTEFVPQQLLELELLWRGTFPCLVLEPKAQFKGILVSRGRLWAYLSADRRRLPLLVKVSTPWGLMTGVIDRESLTPLQPSAN